VHQDDVVSGVTPKKLEALRQESKSLAAVSPAQSTPQPRPVQPQMTVALSFAFDSLTQSLNVIMTDKNSGEAVRKISYKSLPIDVHKAEKLNGLLLDQFA
jgi:hypothetical protein